MFKNAVNGDTPTQPPAAPTVQSPWSPLVERVGVPMLWIGVGYLLCKVTQKPARAA
jgi:hypothetical protein